MNLLEVAKIRILMGLVALAIVMPVCPVYAQKRQAKIAWQSLENAKSYEVQISGSPTMLPVIFTKTTPVITLELELDPATYYFRLRGISENGTKGPWSDVQGFVVHSKAPSVISPKDGSLFREKLPNEGINFAWEKGQSPRGYRFEVRDEHGSWIDRNVIKNQYSWKPQEPGDYQWRVGYDKIAGVEWGPYQNFKVEESALPQAMIKEVIKYVERDKKEKKPPPNYGPEFWAIGRAAMAMFSVTGSEPDFGLDQFSASGVSNIFNFELRWRARQASTSLWQLSGSFNIENVQQEIGGEKFSLLRNYVRVFYTRKLGKWRVGPFIHFNRSEGQIYISNSAASTTVSDKLVRVGAGMGVVGIYDAADTLYLSALIMARYDFGGEVDQIENPIKGAIGLEAGFGVVYVLSPRWMVEGRLRFMTEEYKWNLSNTSGNGSFRNQLILFDLGVGFRL